MSGANQSQRADAAAEIVMRLRTMMGEESSEEEEEEQTGNGA